MWPSTTPGVASSLATATLIDSVTSPYVDLVPTGGIPYYYVVTAVNAVGEGAPSAEVSATPTASPTGTFGNNLSVPLVFADGVGVTGADIVGADGDYTDRTTGLRPTLTDVTSPFPYFNPADAKLFQNTTYYPQRTSSTWQAGWINGKAAMQNVVVDWGDNLRSASLTSGQSVIRVETNLLQLKGATGWLGAESMLGYPMQLLGGQGRTESQGTTGIAEEATVRRVYTITARLKIQKLDGAGVPIPGFACNFDGSIWEGFALPDSSQQKYSSEINVGGAITYGFNWRLGSCAAADTDKKGVYRMTFSLDDTADHNGKTYTNNVTLEAVDAADTTAVLDSPKESHIDVTVN